MEMIETYPDKPWRWDMISWNPNLTMEMIEKHPDKPWEWYWISRNLNITMDFVEKHQDKEWWDWRDISMNPNVTMEMIEKHPEKPWVWEYISMNRNLTMEMIEKHLDKSWNYSFISVNCFETEYKNELEKLEKKYKDIHKKKMEKVMEEYDAILFHPDNMEIGKGLGVYDDVSFDMWSK